MLKVYLYETLEFTYEGKGEIKGSFTVDGETVSVPGFQAGENTIKLRYLPMKAGTCTYQITGAVYEEGNFEIQPAKENRHGPVRAVGTHLAYADGTLCRTYGTTIYALMHQTDALIDETMETLKNSPFNKIRLCVFPKHFVYNANEPAYFAFEKREDGSWDTSKPCFPFWDRFEARLAQLFDLGFQVDLILFHPYDRWGFSSMSREDDLNYLDYVLRRFAAYPNMWWSIANEYDMVVPKKMEDWYEIETYLAEHDPFHHLIGNHHCIVPWQHERPNTTHVSLQTGQLQRIEEWTLKYKKPILIDECGYEGNLKESWGSLSGREMTARFWRTMALGGCCTHGETFLHEEDPDEIVYWAKGGKLIGESPARIAFLRQVMEEIPEPIEPEFAGFSKIRFASPEDMERAIQEGPTFYNVFGLRILSMEPTERELFLDNNVQYRGHCGEDVYLWYLDNQCCAKTTLELPENGTYTVEVIDTWNMTREIQQKDASGSVTVRLPGHEGMAILARKNQNQ